MVVKLKKALKKDLPELRRICLDSYSVYFGDHWNENGLEWYLDTQFGPTKLKSDLQDKDVDYYFITLIDVPVGFIKINYKAVSNISVDPSAELEKMYVLPKHIGKGVGEKAMQKVMYIIQKKGKKLLFLEVLSTNEKGITFYKKLGFKFHRHNRLDLPDFKDHLRGIDRMFIELDS